MLRINWEVSKVTKVTKLKSGGWCREKQRSYGERGLGATYAGPWDTDDWSKTESGSGLQGWLTFESSNMVLCLKTIPKVANFLVVHSIWGQIVATLWPHYGIMVHIGANQLRQVQCAQSRPTSNGHFSQRL
jgi:hypothetical protein